MQLIKPEYMALFYTSCSLFLGQFLIDKANIILDNEDFSQTFVTFVIGLAAVRKENHFYSLPFGQAEASIY